MDPEPNVIREQIEETRSSLTEKLETLEAEVKETMHSAHETMETAKETVQETISSVRESVQSAKETVKRTFDVEYQVNRHPWAMMGLSLASGVALGVLLGGRMSAGRRIARRMAEAPAEPDGRAEIAPAAALSRLAQEPQRPGFMDKLSSQLGDEFEKVKDLAITALVGVVGDVARKSIPALANTVEEMMTRAASEMGAPPQHGPPERPEQAADSTYRPLAY
jgi:ElaB/YqjD/DUF883 family membrane-anchored ribosome-binding protein